MSDEEFEDNRNATDQMEAGSDDGEEEFITPNRVSLKRLHPEAKLNYLFFRFLKTLKALG